MPEDEKFASFLLPLICHVFRRRCFSVETSRADDKLATSTRHSTSRCAVIDEQPALCDALYTTISTCAITERGKNKTQKKRNAVRRTRETLQDISFSSISFPFKGNCNLLFSNLMFWCDFIWVLKVLVKNRFINLSVEIGGKSRNVEGRVSSDATAIDAALREESPCVVNISPQFR